MAAAAAAASTAGAQAASTEGSATERSDWLRRVGGVREEGKSEREGERGMRKERRESIVEKKITNGPFSPRIFFPESQGRPLLPRAPSWRSRSSKRRQEAALPSKRRAASFSLEPLLLLQRSLGAAAAAAEEEEEQAAKFCFLDFSLE